MSSSWSSDLVRVVVSPTLLKNIVVGPVSRHYSLGMDDFLLPESYTDAKEPAPKKRKLSLSLKAGKENQPKDSNHYSKSFVVEEAEFKKMAKGFVPNNTSINTNWAVNNFNSWCAARKEHRSDSEACAKSILENFCPPVKEASKSSGLGSMLGRGYLSTSRAGFIVTL